MFPSLEEDSYDSNFPVVKMLIDKGLRTVSASPRGVLLVLLGTDDPLYIPVWKKLLLEKWESQFEFLEPASTAHWGFLESCFRHTVKAETKVVCATEFVQFTDAVITHILVAGIPDVVHFSPEEFMENLLCYHSLLLHSTPPRVTAGCQVTLVDSSKRPDILKSLRQWHISEGRAIPFSLSDALGFSSRFLRPAPPTSVLDASMRTYPDMEEDTPAVSIQIPPGKRLLSEEDVNAIACHAAKSSSFISFMKSPLTDDAHLDRDVVISLLHGTVNRLNSVHKKEKLQLQSKMRPAEGASAAQTQGETAHGDLKGKLDFMAQKLREKSRDYNKLLAEKENQRILRMKAEEKCAGLQDKLNAAMVKLKEYEEKGQQMRGTSRKEPDTLAEGQQMGGSATVQQKAVQKETPGKKVPVTVQQKETLMRNLPEVSVMLEKLSVSKESEKIPAKEKPEQNPIFKHPSSKKGVGSSIESIASRLRTRSADSESTKPTVKDKMATLREKYERSKAEAIKVSKKGKEVSDADAVAREVAARTISIPKLVRQQRNIQEETDDFLNRMRGVVTPTSAEGTTSADNRQIPATDTPKGGAPPADSSTNTTKSSPSKRRPKVYDDPKPKKPKLSKESYPFKKFSDMEKAILASNATDMCARHMSTAVEIMPTLQGKELARALRQIATSSFMQMRLREAFPAFQDLTTDVINLDTEEGEDSAEVQAGLQKFVLDYKDHYIVGVSFIQVWNLMTNQLSGILSRLILCNISRSRYAGRHLFKRAPFKSPAPVEWSSRRCMATSPTSCGDACSCRRSCWRSCARVNASSSPPAPRMA